MQAAHFTTSCPTMPSVNVGQEKGMSLVGQSHNKLGAANTQNPRASSQRLMYALQVVAPSTSEVHPTPQMWGVHPHPVPSVTVDNYNHPHELRLGLHS